MSFLIVSSFLKARSTPAGVAEHLVDVGDRHAVGHQRPFEILRRRLAHGAFAREFLGVEDIEHGGRRLFQHGRVIGQHVAIDIDADAAIEGRAGQESRTIGDLRIVEADQDAGVAALQDRRGLDRHEVDRHIAGLDHRFDLAELAGIFLLVELDAHLLGEGFEPGLAQRRLPRAAGRHDGELFGAGGLKLANDRGARQGKQGRPAYSFHETSPCVCMLPSGTAPAGKARQSAVGQQRSIASPAAIVASGPIFTVRTCPLARRARRR